MVTFRGNSDKVQSSDITACPLPPRKPDRSGDARQSKETEAVKLCASSPGSHDIDVSDKLQTEPLELTFAKNQ